jgi:hypothetical protein
MNAYESVQCFLDHLGYVLTPLSPAWGQEEALDHDVGQRLAAS